MILVTGFLEEKNLKIVSNVLGAFTEYVCVYQGSAHLGLVNNEK